MWVWLLGDVLDASECDEEGSKGREGGAARRKEGT